MRILKQDKAQNLITLLAENLEDLWHLSNIVEKEDEVEGISFRSFRPNEQTEIEKKKVKIKLKVERIEFSKSNAHLRISGKILDGSPLEYVQLGAYHTLDVQTGFPITIIKNWQKYHLDRIKEAIEKTNMPRLFILLMDEKKALLSTILGFGVEYNWEIEYHRSKKLDQKSFEKEKQKIYQQLEEKLLELDGEILIAGPGFEAKNFVEFLKTKKSKLAKKVILEHCSYAEKSGVVELLKKGVVDKVIKQQQVSFELSLMEEFKTLLAKNSQKIAYGYKNIKIALELNAIERLVVLDSLLSNNKDIKELLLEAEKKAVKIYIFSSYFDAGKELEAFGGLIAFLRYEMSF
ncbi:MAG: mRNA surveillance protein pelota [Candidatus Anstonellaceae archaeon]